MRKRLVWFLLFSTFGLTAQNNLILNPSGTYFLQIQFKDATVIQKIVVLN